MEWCRTRANSWEGSNTLEIYYENLINQSAILVPKSEVEFLHLAILVRRERINFIFKHLA